MPLRVSATPSEPCQAASHTESDCARRLSDFHSLHHVTPLNSLTPQPQLQMHPGSSCRGDETGKGTPPPTPSPLSPSLARSPLLPASLNASDSHVTKTPTSTLGSDFTFDNRITMTICGETIAVDLHTLDSNPTAIIALLTAANTERGNWITVGCFYRRRQNPQAAIAVISALLEGSNAFSVPRLLN
jgi:hypothetical protein